MVLIDVVNLTQSATTAIKLVILPVSAALAADLALVRMTDADAIQDLTRRATADEITVTIADTVAPGVTAEIGVMTVIIVAEVAFVVMTAMTGVMTGAMISGAIADDVMKDAQ